MRFTGLTAILLLVLTNSASAQATWQRPLPQGHTLQDIVFLDNTTAIAVGECGTILVTHDTGDTWVVQSKVLSVTSYKRIDRVDANTAVAVGELGLIARTTDQGATWTPVTVPGMHDTMTDVSFFDALHGIIVAPQRALRTSDGGLTWEVAVVSEPLQSVDMTSPTNAVAVGAATVLYTTNGGETWAPGVSPIPPFNNVVLFSVDFLDPLHGAIAATNGYDDPFALAPARCYLTTDGGTTWTPSDLNDGFITSDFYPHELLHPQVGEVLIVETVHCCVLSAFDPYPSGAFLSTVNSGGLWTGKAVGRTALGLARNDDGVVIVVGEDGRILRRNLDATYTTMGPDYAHLQWARGRSDFLDAQTGIVFISDGGAYMYGDNATYFSRTTDGGETWLNSSTAPVQCLDIAYLSATEIIGVGSKYQTGAVIRSVNGGATWTEIWTGTSPPVVAAVVATSPTRAVAVGSGGNALIIDNGVVTVVPTGGAHYEDIAFAGPSTLLAVGLTDARSIDGGLNWTPIVSPSTAITALDFVSATQAFGVDAGGIKRTDDIGATWVPAFNAPDLSAISFSDANHGVVVGRAGRMFNTIDGGLGWNFVESPTSRDFVDVTEVSPGHVFATMALGEVIEFGDTGVPTLIQSLNALPRAFGAELRWEVVADNNLSGFTITRSSAALRTTIVSDLAITSRSFQDEGLTPGATYEYQLLAVDRDGSFTQSMPVRVTIPVARVELLPNQPNPFNPETTIRFVVPEKMSVQLTIHDVAGRVVAALVNDTREPGNHSIAWNAEGLASGVYFARLRAGKTEVSQKMVLLK